MRSNFFETVKSPKIFLDGVHIYFLAVIYALLTLIVYWGLAKGLDSLGFSKVFLKDFLGPAIGTALGASAGAIVAFRLERENRKEEKGKAEREILEGQSIKFMAFRIQINRQLNALLVLRERFYEEGSIDKFSIDVNCLDFYGAAIDPNCDSVIEIFPTEINIIERVFNIQDKYRNLCSEIKNRNRHYEENVYNLVEGWRKELTHDDREQKIKEGFENMNSPIHMGLKLSIKLHDNLEDVIKSFEEVGDDLKKIGDSKFRDTELSKTIARRATDCDS